MTLKLIAISMLAFLLLIPLGMINSKIHEREMYRHEASSSIASSWTGEQVFYTPFIVQPYVVEKLFRSRDEISANYKVERTEEIRYRYLVPDNVTVNVDVSTERRHRGIYGIPVYTANINVKGGLEKENLGKARNKIKGIEGFLRMDQAWLVIAVSDPRGFVGAPTIKIGGEEMLFEPGTGIDSMQLGLNVKLPDAFENLRFNTGLSLRGMESLRFVPVALSGSFNIQSPWPHPEFFGSTLPLTHEISEKGFDANWQVNQFSTGVISKLKNCEQGSCGSLQEMSFGVKFIEGVDIYLQANRALKYAILFVGLSFVTFFIYETIKKLRIHTVQYTLVGLAIAVFYLLLVSLSEHIAFGLAYFISSVACIALLTYYIRHVLGGWKDAFYFTLIYVSLYGILYVIIQSEDAALLMGSLLIFSVLASIMVATRKVDWYAFNPIDDAKQLGKFMKRSG